jgi:hypothetical protein
MAHLRTTPTVSTSADGDRGTAALSEARGGPHPNSLKQGELSKVDSFTHAADPGAFLPFPRGEGTKDLPQSTQGEGE